MVDAPTAAAAVLGALGSLVADFGVVILDGRVNRQSGRLNRLVGRVDAIEATLETSVSALIGRGWRSVSFGGLTRADDPRPAEMKPATASGPQRFSP